jgi:hypothetical protein
MDRFGTESPRATLLLEDSCVIEFGGWNFPDPGVPPLRSRLLSCGDWIHFNRDISGFHIQVNRERIRIAS